MAMIKLTGIDFNLLARNGGEPVSFTKGDVIFREGDDAHCFYVICDGVVDITLGNRVLKPLSRGEIFGEMALIDGSPRSANAIAKTNVTLIPIDEERFLLLVGRLPYFALNVMRILATRLRETNRAL